MKREKTFFVILILFVSLLTFSQSLYVNTPSAKDYPDSDALVLKEKIVFELESDGKISKKIERVEKVLTYQGLEHIGDPLVAFNKATQSLEIKKLRTYTKEGKVIDAKSNSFNEMTPFELEKSPDYTDIRQMVITKVGMDIDSVVETEYVIKDTKAWRRFFEEAILLCEDIPVLEKEIVVIVPATETLKISLFNSDEKISYKEESGKKIYSIKFKNLPQIKHSEFIDKEEYLTPYLLFSNASSWSQCTKSLNELISKSLDADATQLKEKVSKLTEKEISTIEKIKTVHNFVVEKYRNVEWSLKDFDYKPRTLFRIFETRYGNKMDKAVLLGGMFKSLGINPEFYLFSDNPLIEHFAEIPSLSIFDRVILSVDVEDRKLFFDPTNTLTEFSFKDVIGKKLLKIDENEDQLQLFKDYDQLSEIKFKCSLEPLENLKLNGLCDILLTNHYVNYEKIIANGFDEEVTSFLNEILPNAENVKVSMVELKNEKIAAKATFSVDLKKDCDKKKIFASITTSIPEISLLKKFEGSSKRSLPKMIPNIGKESYEISFVLPDDVKKYNLFNNIVYNGEVKAYQKVESDKNKITLSYGVNVEKDLISPAEFSKVNKAASLLFSESFRTIYLEEKKQ